MTCIIYTLRDNNEYFLHYVTVIENRRRLAIWSCDIDDARHFDSRDAATNAINDTKLANAYINKQ